MDNKSIEIMDPNILLSLINTKLRDEYESLDLLSEDLNINKDTIIKKLKEIDYYYDKEKNSFK